MGDGQGRPSEAEAHLELLIRDSRVAGVISENFIDRFRRQDLAHSDILDRVADLLNETRICGDRIIHIGKILVEEILRFIERKPDISSGFQLEVATRALSDLAPPLGPLLAPLASEMEYQGYGGVFRGTDFVSEVNDEAALFFKQLSTTMTLCDDLLFAREKVNAAAPSVQEPNLFAPGGLSVDYDPKNALIWVQRSRYLKGGRVSGEMTRIIRLVRDSAYIT